MARDVLVVLSNLLILLLTRLRAYHWEKDVNSNVSAYDLLDFASRFKKALERVSLFVLNR